MLKQAEITTAIKSIPWFLDLAPESIQRLNKIADIRTFEPGEVIYHEGEKHPYFYVVLEGRVLLESYVAGRGSLPVLIAESLDVISWSSLTPVVRQKTSTARVLSPTSLLTFHADALMACCEEDCELGFVVMRRLANIVASRLLNHRLQLLEIITCQD